MKNGPITLTGGPRPPSPLIYDASLRQHGYSHHPTCEMTVNNDANRQLHARVLINTVSNRVKTTRNNTSLPGARSLDLLAYLKTGADYDD